MKRAARCFTPVVSNSKQSALCCRSLQLVFPGTFSGESVLGRPFDKALDKALHLHMVESLCIKTLPCPPGLATLENWQ